MSSLIFNGNIYNKNGQREEGRQEIFRRAGKRLSAMSYRLSAAVRQRPPNPLNSVMRAKYIK
jgi:hypothetical protein